VSLCDWISDCELNTQFPNKQTAHKHLIYHRKK